MLETSPLLFNVIVSLVGLLLYAFLWRVTQDLPMAAKVVNAGWNDGSIRWRVLPRDRDTLRQATQSFETDSGLLNADCSAIPVTVFTSDHQSSTRQARWLYCPIPRVGSKAQTVLGISSSRGSAPSGVARMLSS